jgi:hypothetical protein
MLLPFVRKCDGFLCAKAMDLPNGDGLLNSHS